MSHAVSCEEWMRRAAAAERERDDARNYVAEVAQGVTHYPHDAGEPCVRCDRDDANDHIAETQEWFARHGITCGADGSLLVAAERLLDERDELRALCDGLRAEINHLRARIEGSAVGWMILDTLSEDTVPVNATGQLEIYREAGFAEPWMDKTDKLKRVRLVPEEEP